MKMEDVFNETPEEAKASSERFDKFVTAGKLPELKESIKQMKQTIKLAPIRESLSTPGAMESACAEKYTEIFRLKKMLEDANISFRFYWKSDLMGFHLIYPATGDKRVCSVVEHAFSYGSSKNLLEIMGLLTDAEKEDDFVAGYLTADDVFERIRKADAERNKNNGGVNDNDESGKDAS